MGIHGPDPRLWRPRQTKEDVGGVGGGDGPNSQRRDVRCILRCISTRTQVYLTDQQRQRIDELAESEGVTMAEIIRRALDGYLDEQPDSQAALAATFGADPDAAVPSRDEWDRG